MAIVLVIIGLLLGGLIPALSAQMESQRINETRRQLNEISNALSGYAIINGKLPCPSTVAYGEPDDACASPSPDSYLPWKTLGVSETDAWGGKWRYRVDAAFASSASFTLTTTPSSSLQIQDGSGNAITSNSERPVAIVFSTGKNLSADGQNSSFDSTYQSNTFNPDFDDLMIWISRPQLFNRMVTAGRLP